MAKHMSLAKIAKTMKHANDRSGQSEAERNRNVGLQNSNGRHTYGLRMHRAANNPGSGSCPGGCGRRTSIGRYCLACAKVHDDAGVGEPTTCAEGGFK